MPDIAVQVEHLSKMYRLGVINNGTLWQDLQTFFAFKFGKEDPNSKIGEDKYSGDKDHFWALKDISFDIKQGDRIGIIGKNGAGKSTLLKILSRITAPTEGTIKIKGKVASLLEVGTGFHGELTGRENIYLNGAILGMKKRRIDEKLDDIIEFSGIEQHIDTPVKRYSSGMYVRLAFAVAAHLDSDILIADEVLAVGDAEFQNKALGKMNDLSTGEGRTVLFVSHNMGMVKRLCDTSILLFNGEIITSGKTQDVIDTYQAKKKSGSRITRTKNELHSSIYISSVFTCDSNGTEKSLFAFSEDIHFRIGITMEKLDPIMKISLALLAKDETRVFSDYIFLKDICDNDTGEIVVDYIIKGSFIAPSNYSFLIAIDNKTGSVTLDCLHDICPIKIFDDGTDYAEFEGYHYGFFLISDECEWKRIK
jgi:lipopolysaccharide transport system ATP-binding protein